MEDPTRRIKYLACDRREILMGFGLLFVGYFMAYVMSLVIIPGIIGYLLMTWANVKLSQYDLYFKRCIPILGFLCLVSTYSLIGDIFSYMSIESAFFSDGARAVVQTVEKVLSFTYQVSLMLAVRHIAIDTELPNLAYKAFRNLSVGALSMVVYLIAWFLPNNDFVKILTMSAFILEIVWIVLTLVLIASCYRLICDESDLDMPVRDVNIPIIGKMEEIMRKRDQNAYNAAKDMAEKRRRKKEARRNKKQK